MQEKRRSKTLVIMAAGMASRYGGLKQVEPVGPSGELIVDYSAYDAINAGFDRIVFVISKSMEDEFRAGVAARVGRAADVRCAIQSIDDLPDGYSVPDGRTRPWGTVHAVISAADHIDGAFAVINADDFYGGASFAKISSWLDEPRGGEIMAHAMAAYRLSQTLPERGPVTRGVCEVTNDLMLARITERRGVERDGSTIRFSMPNGGSGEIVGDPYVSMNFWALDEKFLETVRDGFPRFLQRELPRDPLGCEYLLPDEIERELSEGIATVKVLISGDKWHGLTYRSDRASVVYGIGVMHADGVYPTPLWG